MDYKQVMSMMEQYALAGKDARTLFEDCTALAAAGKTPLGLNQWVKSDKPAMEDFNEDNRVIDEKLQQQAQMLETLNENCREIDSKLREPTQELELALDPALKAYSPCKYAKDVFGRVTVNVAVQSALSNDGIVPNMAVATMPSGFRPVSRTTSSGVAKTANGELAPIFLIAYTDGRIIVGTDQRLSYLGGEISFMAQ